MTTAREDTFRLADLLRREHDALAEFLIALATFDRERRWSELGYASLFDFLRRELKLSAGAAQYRKTAAQLVREYPDIEAALRRGDLCLSSVIEVAKVITRENAADVLPRFFGKSSRDAAFVAASIRPVADPPKREFFVTPVRAPAVSAPASLTESAFRAPEVTSPAPAPTPDLLALACAPSTDRPKIRPLDAERARINMTVSREVLDLLAQARDALSHSHPNASEETIIKVGLQLVIERHRKRRGIGTKPRKKPAAPVASEAPAKAPPLPSPTARSRYIPVAVRRAVWERDGGCCAFPLENGGVCGSTRQLEFDHVEGWALGAGHTVDELRVACKEHQDVNARRLFGDRHMNKFTRPKGPGCSEPVAVYGLSAAARPRRCPRRTRTGPRSGTSRRRCRTSPRSPRSAC